MKVRYPFVLHHRIGDTREEALEQEAGAARAKHTSLQPSR